MPVAQRRKIAALKYTMVRVYITSRAVNRAFEESHEAPECVATGRALLEKDSSLLQRGINSQSSE